MAKVINSLFYICLFNGLCAGWRAVPANEAMYAIRSGDAGIAEDYDTLPDHLLPRNTLHSTYKFGYCTQTATKSQFLRTTVNMSLFNLEESAADYIYVVADMSTQKFSLQCVVMKIYTARKFQFYKSRLPLYYCHGQLILLMMDTVQRLAVHEFYLYKKLNLFVDIFFEFYQPPSL